MIKDREKLYAYLDGELNQAEIISFEQELKNNPELKKEFEFSRILSSQIRESLQYELMRQNPHAEEVDLWVSIKDQVLQHHSHTEKIASSALFSKIKDIFRLPAPVFSPAFAATAFMLVFAFYLGQKAEQYINQDVATTAEREKVAVIPKANNKPTTQEVVNLDELSFVTSQSSSYKNTFPRTRSFRSSPLSTQALPPKQVYESSMPDCFINLRTPHLGLSPKEPLELGREKQVSFKASDGSLQRLRLRALSFSNERLEMQINWFNQTGENLLSENIHMPNGSRIRLEAGDKPEAQTRVVLAAQCG